MPKNKLNSSDSTETTSDYYIPPFKKSSKEPSNQSFGNREYQEYIWNNMEKNIKGELNKLNLSNIEYILAGILKNNIIKGRGILVNCILRAQLSSQKYTSVFAILSAIINCNIPDIGSLLVKRLISQFKSSYSNNNKIVCKSTLKFLAQLINRRVVHELTALQICLFLMEVPTDDSIEVCIEFILECGEFLLESSPQGLNTVMDKLRRILQEGKAKKRTGFLIERVLKERRLNFRNFASNKDNFVDPNDQITHFFDLLDDGLDIQDELDYFTETDPTTFENEDKKWMEISKELLSELDCVKEESVELTTNSQLFDVSDQELVLLKKRIYLCIMNSLNYEECSHRIIKLGLPDTQTNEVSTMILDCCSMERTYQKFFSLVAERLCNIKKEYQESFKQLFTESYEMAHRLETNKLRHVTKFYSYLLSKDAIPWSLMSIIQLSDNETASSSRIFIKILFQELSGNMGLTNLEKKLNSIDVSPFIEGIFPINDMSKIRFSINFFTAIGLSTLTKNSRIILKELEQNQTKVLEEFNIGSINYEIPTGLINSENSSLKSEVLDYSSDKPKYSVKALENVILEKCEYEPLDPSFNTQNTARNDKSGVQYRRRVRSFSR
ncbi:cell-cycle-control protein [Cryptosporidium felis]|nr:cell-cycle-control protein [Cryptosporidium felis]